MDEDIVREVKGFVSNESDEESEETTEPIAPCVSASTTAEYIASLMKEKPVTKHKGQEERFTPQ